MCKYQYQTQNLKVNESHCYLNNFFHHNKLIDDDYVLPIDNQGFCLFHSNQQHFKIENKLEVVLRKFIQYSNSDSNLKIIDLRGFNFCSEAHLVIKDLNFTKEINFCDSNFISPIHFFYCDFQHNCFFDHIKANDEFLIDNCTFRKNFTAVDAATFEKHVKITNVKFHHLFDINHSIFHDHVTLSEVTFLGYTNFQYTSFQGPNSLTYFNINIEGPTEFDYVNFGGPIEFQDCHFNKDTTFNQTIFQGLFMLTAPKINSTILFRGTEHKRMFESNVEFQISEDSFENTGQLIFEYSNLIYLDGLTKVKLTLLQKSRRIVLGEGTEVYLFSFQENYPYSSLNELFLSELLAKIKRYFDYNLAQQFEFVMVKDNDDVVITFFTDDYARQNDFKAQQFEVVRKMLTQKEKDMDKVNQYLSNHLKNVLRDALLESGLKNINPETLINTISLDNINIFIKGKHQFANEIANYYSTKKLSEQSNKP